METQDYIKELVVRQGDDIGMNEPVCVIWKSDHKNCFGCPSELGCSKMVSLHLIEMQPMVDKEMGTKTDYALIKIAMHLILESKDLSDVKKITDEICGI